MAALAGVCPACLMGGAQALASELNSGVPELVRQIGGYDLLERIGRGGMGVVYRARQRSLDRIVAVKMISAGELAAPETLRRFKLEAAAAARLQHPGLVAIHEVGEHDGLPFFSHGICARRTHARRTHRGETDAAARGRGLP